MDDIIARIKRKLAYFEPYNVGHVSESLYQRRGVIAPYPYGVYMTHTEEEIAAFEARFQIRLLEDYRQFIKEIGSEGFNPGQTMHSPLVGMVTDAELKDYFEKVEELREESDEEWFENDDGWKEDAPLLGNLHHPFPFNQIMTPDVVDHFNQKRSDPLSWGGDGFLTIVQREQGSDYLLIVTGEARGQIWYQESTRYFTPVFKIDGKAYWPHYGQHDKVPADAPRLTFTEWYDLWLDEEIRSTQARWVREGRNVPPLILD